MKSTSLAAVVTVLATLSAGSRAEENATLVSYRTARAALETAAQAHGGREALSKLSNLTATLSGQVYNAYQNRHPERPLEGEPIVQGGTLDLAGKRLTWRQEVHLLGGFRFDYRTVVKADGGLFSSVHGGTYSTIPAAGVQGNWDTLERHFPPLVLRRALAKAASARSLGTATIDGRAHQAVSFPWSDSVTATLYLDAETHRLSRADFLQFDAILGDNVLEISYLDYAPIGGISLPRRQLSRRGGELYLDLGYSDLALDRDLAGLAFELPPGLRLEEPPPLTVATLAPGVFLVEGIGGGLYRILFVEQADGVLVVDAPISPAVSAAVMAKIRETVPGKPIRRLVLTHYHGDHSGGARAFMAEGAEILTTAGNRAYLERLARAPYTLNPDTLAARPREPVLAFVDGRKSVTDAERPVEVLAVGPTPHVEEMLVVYLPKQRLLFEGDLFSFLVPINETMRDFAARFPSLGLEIDRIAGVHHPVMTVEEWRAAVEQR